MPRDLLSIHCPHCGFRFKVDAKYGGRATRCPEPNCKRKLRVPQRKVTAAVADDARVAENQNAPSSHETDYDLDARSLTPKTQKSGSRSTKQTPQGRDKRDTHPKKERRQRKNSSGNILSGLKTWQAAVGATGVVVAIVCVMLAPNGSTNPGGVTNNSLAAAEKAPGAAKPKVDLFKTKLQPFVKTYCQECHSADDPQAGINLLSFKTEAQMLKGKNRKTWEMVLSMVEIGAMPPNDMDQPKDSEVDEVVAYLEDKLYNLDCDMIDDPGRVTVRRLNRTEYNNTVRDLLGVTFKPADDFPSDDVGYGFDNIGDVLSLSPLLMEKYLDAAEKITAQAIPSFDAKAGTRQFTVGQMDKAQHRRSGDFYALSSVAEVTFSYDAPIDGEYTFKIDAKADQFGGELAKMVFSIDRKKLQTFSVKGQRIVGTYEHKVKLKGGRHRIGMAFTNDAYVKNRGDRNLYVGTANIVAPKIPAKTEGFVSTRPSKTKTLKQAATEVLTPFINKAFRRPATDAEVARYVGIVELATKEGEGFDQSIQYAVQGVLVSPSFLFRVETDQKPDDPMAERNISDYELASRLSYFIWSTMPDDKLFELASSGKLHQPVVLEQQVKRLLADPKSSALTDNFAEQWLNLRSLDDITPDPKLFKGFNVALRDDMKRETLLLFDTIKGEDRSILDFLDADFTFVNNRLAQHYGMKNVAGDKFQRISLNPKQRAGVLTHASVLTITSNPDRTSPVKRGKWIMENVLGTSPPPPPPNVPELEETRKAKPNATLREQLELHRKDPGCASCHRTMDALGFGFENFDAVGIWRDKDGKHDIDSSGDLPAGGKFAGPTELIQILKNRKKQFSRCLSEKMLTYALGRGLEYYDRCAIDEILDRLDRKQYRFSQLVIGIVNSRPFLNRRGDGERE
jgi:mono/diheme cytochrome c family protein